MKFVIGIALLSALLGAPAKARDVEVDTILTCDTQGQAERVGTLLHGDAQNVVSAVREVNAEENNQTACSLVDAAYVRGKVLTTVRAKGETFQIVPILVIGILDETGVQSVPQNVYFSVFEIDERVA
jgi:hypothetical protein